MAKSSRKQAVRNKARVPFGQVVVKVRELKYGDYAVSYGIITDVGVEEHMLSSEITQDKACFFVTYSPQLDTYTKHYFPEHAEVSIFRYIDLPEKRALQHARGAGTLAQRRNNSRNRLE